MIRPTTKGDVAALTGLCRQLGYEVAEHDVAARLSQIADRDDHLVLIAEEGVVVAFVHAYQSVLLESSPGVEVGGLVVSEPARRIGLGSALMTEVERWAFEVGAHEVRFRSNVTRKGAHRFYRALGYQRTKKSFTFVKRLEG